ncbi:hypothetical protein D3C86_1710600 [compost metagenome]
MANRICLGNRNGTYGLFVSKPGHDVLTTADANLTFDSRVPSVWVVTRGSVSIPANQNTASVAFGGMTAIPIIEINRQVFYEGYNQWFITATTGRWNISATASALTFTRNGEYGDSVFNYVIYGVPF